MNEKEIPIAKFVNDNINLLSNRSKIPFVYRERHRKGELKIAGMIAVAERLGVTTKTLVIINEKED